MTLQNNHFEHFGNLDAEVARMGSRIFILSTLTTWIQIYGQNGLQNAHFEHFGDLDEDMARMSTRMLRNIILRRIYDILQLRSVILRRL